mgnify:FL=1
MEAMQVFSIDYWGGMNARDQADQLVSRSHAQVEGGWRQFPGIGVESPDLLNIDYDPLGIRKRYGSASYQDLSAVMASGDSLVAGIEWTNADSTTMELIVTTTRILTNASGTWGAINATSGASVFAFTGAVTKASLVPLDGHMFIFTNGTGNYIQTTRNGTQIDPQMVSGNVYTDAYGSGTHTITGTWPTASHLGAAVNSRLCAGEEGLLIEYTPMLHESSSGVWDLAGGGAGAFHVTSGEMLFMTNYIPKGGNRVTDEVLVVGTSGGIESTTGFEEYDRLNVEQGAEGVLNHKCYCKGNGWLIYLTRNKNLQGYNGQEVIDFGARLRTAIDTGPLDAMDLATSETNAFAMYLPEKMQAVLWYSTATTKVNDSAAMVDFKMGEPVPGEPQRSAEARVRVVPWEIFNGADNDWFIHGYIKSSAVIGIKANGTTWTMESGKNDLASVPIEGRWKSPIINGGAPFVTFQKQFIRLNLRVSQNGVWTATIDEYFDGESAIGKTWDMNQYITGAFILDVSLLDVGILSTEGHVRAFDRIDKRAESFQFQFKNKDADEDFVLRHANLLYSIGSQVN